MHLNLQQQQNQRASLQIHLSVVDAERLPDIDQNLDEFKPKSQILPLEAEWILVHPS